jgi:long-chain acyl-CoA synthetase
MTVSETWSAQTIPDILRERAGHTPQMTALSYQSRGQTWQSLSWTDYWRQARSLAATFRELGLAKGDRLGMLAPTSLEWELAHLATVTAGGILVGLEPHDRPERLQRIAAQSDLNALFVKDRTLLNKLAPALLRPCKFIVMLEPDPAPLPDLPLILWQSLAQCSVKTVSTPEALPAPTDAATIIYTSGTTGAPKGILYNHRQIILACASIVEAFPQIQAGSRFVCWLPLSNLFQRMMNLCAMAIGGTTYLVGDPLKVMAAVRVVEPDIFIGIPRFYEKLYAGIQKDITRKPMWMQRIMRLARDIGGRYAKHLREGSTPSPGLRLAQQLSDRLVLRHIRGIMGSRLQFMIAGSAPMPVWLLEAFHAMGLLILEAYGLSENAMPIAMNRPNSFRFGSVGKSLLANEVRFGPEGDIMVRGPGLFSGYYQDANAQNCFTPDGFYATGDYGGLDAAGFLQLKGRSSEIIKTSSGRRIAPVGIEVKLREIPYIDQAVVLGFGRKCLVGLLTIDWDMLETWAKATEVERPTGQEAALPELVCHLIVTDLKQRMQHLPRYEQPAGFLVLRHGFSIEGGELTANLKLRRRVIEEKYLSYIEKLYAEVDHRETMATAVAHDEPVLHYL